MWSQTFPNTYTEQGLVTTKRNPEKESVRGQAFAFQNWTHREEGTYSFTQERNRNQQNYNPDLLHPKYSASDTIFL